MWQTLTRTFDWQEKVFGSGEVRHLLATDPASLSALESRYKTAINTEGTSGSPLFTYVHADRFVEDMERESSVTTSASEGSSHLVESVFGRKSKREFKYQAMYILVNANEQSSNEAWKGPGEEGRVLCCIKAYANGSFDVKPGFTSGGTPYRFVAPGGGVFEYTLENAANNDVSTLEARQQRLAKELLTRAAGLRRMVGAGDFEAPPGPSSDAVRLLLNVEIVAAKAFQRDRLFVEYHLKYDDTVWECGEQWLPQLHGFTQISVGRRVHFADDDLPTSLACFGHPFEVELTAQKEPAAAWPILYFHVASYDRWDRCRPEGYGYLALAGHCPGTREHVVDTWRPVGSVRQQLHSFFVGGGPQLRDVTYVRQPVDWAGPVLSKYGFRTQPAGQVKIRTSSMLHKRRVKPLAASGYAIPRSLSPTKPPKQRSAFALIERARQRLAEAKASETLKGHSIERPPP
ncbi:B9 domain-containing protein [Klebsormidium nitens]|uniref:B9 domain-containing protein n=1 Tax=Klebsormidium nitens TaxID=105231 RepID=A0A1Y1I4J4_KLENI|nr:B9 domain-containing protein [Klebsormidium nitens]|eukprot:GAQ85865.1 B9 domain-containing protein [Klebsormidium nitens]